MGALTWLASGLYSVTRYLFCLRANCILYIKNSGARISAHHYFLRFLHRSYALRNQAMLR